MSGVSKSYYGRILGTFWRHPRSASLSLAAAGAWAKLVSWSADFRSDGKIPRAALPQILGRTGWKVAVSDLVSSGMLEETSGDCIQIRDWSQHNITKEEHENNLARNREKVGKSRKEGAQKPVTQEVQAEVPKEPGNRLRNGLPSDQDQDQDQDKDPLRGSGALDSGTEPRLETGPAPDPFADPGRAEVDAAKRLARTVEAIRADLVERYRRVAAADPMFTVPTRDLAAFSKPIDELARAFVGRKSAWDATVEGFFASPKAKADGYPLAWLARNPSQFVAKQGITTGNGPRRSDVGAGATLDLTGRGALSEREAAAYERAKGRELGTWPDPPKPWEPSHVEAAIAKGWNPAADARLERGVAA